MARSSPAAVRRRVAKLARAEKAELKREARAARRRAARDVAKAHHVT
jgi:hypothetical protein